MLHVSLDGLNETLFLENALFLHAKLVLDHHPRLALPRLFGGIVHHPGLRRMRR
jgi:hypothetical protein